MTAEVAERNPNMADGDWAKRAHHWKCVLHFKRRQLTTYFSSGGDAEPVVDDTLECLVLDASTVENTRDFEEWASDLGYDADSRSAERTFRACEDGAAKLKSFLGDDLYATALYKLERL